MIDVNLDTSSSDHSEDEVKNEVNWGSKTKGESTAKKTRGKRRKARSARKPPPVPQPQENSEEEEKEKPAPPPKPEKKRRARKVSPRSKPKATKKEVKKPVQAAVQDEEFEDEPQLLSFDIIREDKKTAKARGADYRFMDGDTPLFYAIISKDDISAVALISSSVPISKEADSYVGMLRRFDHGKRFTVITKEEKMNDDREGQLLGMAYITPPVKTKTKFFRIATVLNEHPHYPITPRLDLANIVVENLELPKFEFFTTKLPELITAESTPKLNFGDLVTIESEKNCIIEKPETNEPLFMLYKNSESTFKVKCMEPLSPFMAFALGIAVIT